jgi:hypothetical protein
VKSITMSVNAIAVLFAVKGSNASRKALRVGSAADGSAA